MSIIRTLAYSSPSDLAEKLQASTKAFASEPWSLFVVLGTAGVGALAASFRGESTRTDCMYILSNQ